MEGLVKHGILHTRIAIMEWLVPCGEDVPASLDGYVVAFVPFIECGLVSPPHRFL
jgi:hypothetical protein